MTLRFALIFGLALSRVYSSSSDNDFWGLGSALMLPFHSESEPMDLVFGPREDPVDVARRYLNSMRRNASSSALFFGCADESCSKSSIAQMVRAQQNSFWGRDEPLLLTVQHGRPLDKLVDDLERTCEQHLMIGDKMCKVFQEFILSALIDRSRLCRSPVLPPRAVSPMSQPKRILVASVPRSGNGWLRDIISKLGDEVQTRRECGREYRAREEFEAKINWERQQQRQQQEEDVEVDVAPSISWERNVKYFFAKSHFPFDSAGNCGCREEIGDESSDASCVIQMVRNPFDNHNAWLRYLAREIPNRDLGGPGLSFVRFVNQWAFFHEWWAERDGSATQGDPRGTGRVTVLRYEDLLENPKKAIAKALQFCGVDLEDRQARETSSDLEGMLERIIEETAHLKPHSTDKVGKSFRKYSREEVEYVLSHHRSLMDRFNYTGMVEHRALAESKLITTEVAPPGGFEDLEAGSSLSARSGQRLSQVRRDLHDRDFTLFFLSPFLQGRYIDIYTQGSWKIIQ